MLGNLLLEDLGLLLFCFLSFDGEDLLSPESARDRFEPMPQGVYL